jgi:hypothetical protein
MANPCLYYLGLDLGQARDYSALSIIEEQLYISSAWDSDIFYAQDVERGLTAGWVSPAALNPHQVGEALWHARRFGRPAEVPLAVRHLERFELGTKYTKIIQSVKRLLMREPLRGRLARTRLLVDRTGVGASVVDGFVQSGVYPIAITIHGGSTVTREPRSDIYSYRVPKRDLVAAVQTLLQNERLKVAESLTLAPVLKKELLNFRVKISPETAHDSYEHWREGDHDDLVLATALAAWFREHTNSEVERRNARQGGFRVRSDYAGEYARPI